MNDNVLSIVIITKDTKDLVESLLTSIKEDKSLVPLLGEVIVIDNNSQDGTDAMVQAGFPGVVYRRQDNNRGFAAAANEGFRSATGKFILYLNSDTILIPGEMEKLVAFMSAHPDIGICGPQLIHDDRRFQRSFAAVPSLLLEIVPDSLLRWVAPRRYPSPKRTYHGPVEVDSLIGAAVVVSRVAMKAAGGFDERFFFFLEETDLCVRMGKMGFRVVFFPGASIVHLQGKTVSRNWVRGRIEYNISLDKFIAKHHGGAYRVAYRSVRLIKTSLYIVLVTVFPFILLSAKRRRRCNYYVQLLLWYLKGRRDYGGLRVNSQG